MKANRQIRAANRTVSRAVRAAEKQGNFERLFRSIERAQAQAEKEAAVRREAAARFSRIVTAPKSSKRERQRQFNRLFGIVKKRLKKPQKETGADGGGGGGGGEGPGGEEWEEYESSLSYRR